MHHSCSILQVRKPGKLRQRHAKTAAWCPLPTQALPAWIEPTTGLIELNIPAMLPAARPLEAGLVNGGLCLHGLLNAALAASHGSLSCLQLSGNVVSIASHNIV